MAKFESPAIVKRKLQAELGKNAPDETCIIVTYARFFETGSVEDPERSGRPSKITENRLQKRLCVMFFQIL